MERKAEYLGEFSQVFNALDLLPAMQCGFSGASKAFLCHCIEGREEMGSRYLKSETYIQTFIIILMFLQESEQ